MTNTCCCCFSLRLGTIIISVIPLIYYLLIPFEYNGTSILAFYTVQTLEDGTKMKTPTVIDVSPQVMDYVFAVFLPVVTLAMLLSAILKKSEILFYAMITFIIASILLTAYSTLGEEGGWWFQQKFPPPVAPSLFKSTDEVDALSESERSLSAVIGYVIEGYFMFVVYSYVQQLRQAIPTSDIKSPLIF